LLSIAINAWEDKAKDLSIRRIFSSPHNWGYSLDDDARRRIEKTPEWKQYHELLLGAFESQSARAARGSLPQHEQAGGTVPKTDNAEALSGGGAPAEQRESSPIGTSRNRECAALNGSEPSRQSDLGPEDPANGVGTEPAPPSHLGTATENGASQRTAPAPGLNGRADSTSFAAADRTKHERRRAVVDPILKAKEWTVNKWGTQAGVGKNCGYEYLAGRRNLTSANRLALAEVLGLKTADLPN